MFRWLLTCFLAVQIVSICAQASLATLGTPYTQNFNSLPNSVDGAAISGWANNTYLTGWYSSITPVIEASCGPTAASVINSGSVYVIASGTDRNLGSRPSNTSGAVSFGLRLVNSTSSTITSLYIIYYGEQWSIAENGTNVNTLSFSYQTGATVTSLTTGTWINAPALNFTQLYTSSQSAGLGGTACTGTSNQCLALNGNLSANRIRIESCITVNIPAGEEIMLRWSDANDALNDHHLQIDDLEIWPFADPCVTILPVELTYFSAQLNNKKPLLRWETASEKDNTRFEIERSSDGETYEHISNVAGNGTTSQLHSYSFFDPTATSGIYYYRLKQIDFNGSYSYSPIRAIEVPVSDNNYLFLAKTENGLAYQLQTHFTTATIEVWSADGALVYSIANATPTGILPLRENGLYLIRIATSTGETLLIQKAIY